MAEAGAVMAGAPVAVDAAPAREGKIFLPYIHKFRGLAIIGIVGAHALPAFRWPRDGLIFPIVDTICNQSSIWFFFIAGFLFQHLTKRFDAGKFYTGKFQTVILPYLILSIPALLVALYLIPQQGLVPYFYDLPKPVQAVLFLLTGSHLAPFWFVPAVSVIYLLSPLLLKMDRKVWPYLVLPPLLVMGAILGRTGFHDVLNLSPLIGPVSNAVYLLPAYMFGMFCSHFRVDLIALMARIWPVVLVVSAALFSANVYWFGEQHYLIFAFKIVAAPLIIYALSLRPSIGGKPLDLVADVSFGIFFIHGYFLAGQMFLWKKLVSPELPPGSIPAFIALTLEALLLSCIVLWVGRKVLGKRSRMLLGA